MARERKSGDETAGAGLVGEIFHAAAVDLAGRALVAVLLLAALVLGLLVWDGGSVPAWAALAAVLVVIGVAVRAIRAQAQAKRDVEVEVDELAEELGRHSEYAGHLQNSLDALQRVICGDVGAGIPYFIEQGVLEPTLRILAEKPTEDIRLSVLLPSDEDPERWSMRWSAGHSMVGKLKYRERIDATLARHSFERSEAQYWADTETQSDFHQNPLASSPTRSLVSIPITEGDTVLGVFNAVSSAPDAFDEAEQTFLDSLAGVIAVAVGVWRREGRGADF